MIVPSYAVLGLIVLESSTSRIVSAQPFPTLPAKFPEEQQQQHGEFGNVAEGSNTAGADDGLPGTFQFLGGGDGEDEEEGESTTSARSRSEDDMQEMQAADAENGKAKGDKAAKSHKGGIDDVEADGADAAVPTAAPAAPTLVNPTIA